VTSTAFSHLASDLQLVAALQAADTMSIPPLFDSYHSHRYCRLVLIALNFVVCLQIEVREIHADESAAGRLARSECFMFSIEDVFANLAAIDASNRDPDVVLAQKMLAKSRHDGPQAQLWIAQVRLECLANILSAASG
jgi:hypothetical protein